MRGVERGLFVVCVGSLMVGALSSAGAQDQKLRQALQQQAEVSFVEQPLTEVLEALQAQYDVPVQLDVAGIAAEGISPEAAVTLQHQKLSLQSALNLILRQLDLTWTLDGATVVATTIADAESRQTKRRYQIGQAPPDDVMQLLTTCSNGQWINVHGDGGEISVAAPGFIEVLQDQRSHLEIEALFGDLARMLNPRNAPAPSRVQAANSMLRSKVLRTKLRSERGQDTVTLGELADSLIREHGIPVWIDLLQLDEQGNSEAESVQLPAGTTPVAALLDQTLTRLNLTWRIQHETVVITTMTHDENSDDMPIIVYDTTRLLGRGQTPRQLLQGLYSQSGVESWTDTNGSPGAAFIIGNVLVVKQSAAGHRKVDAWLKSLR